MERLSDEDVAILRLERGNVRGHTCKVVVVRHGLTVERLRAHVGLRLGSVPRLRQRLVETPLGLANPSWADDPTSTSPATWCRRPWARVTAGSASTGCGRLSEN